MSTYRLTIEVEVRDPRTLYDAALKRATLVDGLDWTTAVAILTIDGGAVDKGACLNMIFDPGMSPPGTKIIQSVVEETSV